MGDPTLSFIICTYNRAPYLRRLILSLLAQTSRYKDLEIVVVDNNSVDDTRAVVNDLSRRDSIVRYVHETKQGLSNARNGGAAAARGEYLLFLDDDALTPDGFIDAIHNTVCNQQPDLFGGPIYPLYADPRPEWFPEGLEVREKASQSGFTRNITLSGGNFGIKANVLELVGGFDTRFGMVGNKVGMLEERLVVDQYKLIFPAENTKIYYDIDAWILHHTPEDRMTRDFQKRRIYLSEYQSTLYSLSQSNRSSFGFFIHQLSQYIKRRGKITRVKMKDFINGHGRTQESFNIFIRCLYSKGKLCGAFDHLFLRRRIVRFSGGYADSPRQPLRVLWISMPESGSTAKGFSREAKSHGFISDLIKRYVCDCKRIIFNKNPTKKVLLNSILESGPGAYDLLLLEGHLPKIVGQQLRTHFPGLQILILLGCSGLNRTLEEMPEHRSLPIRLMRHLGPLYTEVGRDRTTLRYADWVVVFSRSEQRYLRLLSPTKKIYVSPPLIPKHVLDEAVRDPVKASKLIISMGDVKRTATSKRHAIRAASYFKRDRLVDAGFKAAFLGKVKGDISDVPEGATVVGLASDRFRYLGSAFAILYPDRLRGGTPSRFLEAIASNTQILAPAGTKARVHFRIGEWIQEFTPAKSGDLLATAENAWARSQTLSSGREAIAGLEDEAFEILSGLLKEAESKATFRPQVAQTTT